MILLELQQFKWFMTAIHVTATDVSQAQGPSSTVILYRQIWLVDWLSCYTAV